MNKKGQTTIFIIIGLLVAVTIVLVFFLSNRFNFSPSPTDNPENAIRTCIIRSIQDAEERVLATNGYPQEDFPNYVLYKKERIPYLCTVSEFYLPCIPQEPAFFSYVQGLMEEKINKDTEKCLNDLKKDLEKKGYSVEQSLGSINLSIRKEYIQVHLDKKIFITKKEESKEISNLRVFYGTNFYDLLRLVQTIVNYESTLCEFNKMNWMRYDNSIAIFTDRTSDQTKVYTLREKLHDREIKFAIKTCILPAGI